VCHPFGFGRSTTQFVFAYPVLYVVMSDPGSTFGHSLVNTVLRISLITAFVREPSFGRATGTLVQVIIVSCPCEGMMIHKVWLLNN
jgi:hypothetical protein